jgi:hypothetical protein
MNRFRKIVRIVWPLAGLTFMAWLWLSFRAQNLPEGVMDSDTAVTVTETSQTITFQPTNPSTTGLIFYPGAMVEPTAYAPLARIMAEAGYLTIIVKLPWGTAPLASHEAQLWQTTQAAHGGGQRRSAVGAQRPLTRRSHRCPHRLRT